MSEADQYEYTIYEAWRACRDMRKRLEQFPNIARQNYGSIEEIQSLVAETLMFLDLNNPPTDLPAIIAAE